MTSHNMNIYAKVREKIIAVLQEIVKQNQDVQVDLSNIVVEIPNDPSHGEISTNAAMALAKPLKSSPKIIASQIKGLLENEDLFKSISIAPNGFINFNLNPQHWYAELSGIIDSKEQYGKSNIGSGKSINVEFASPNPTGPMHIGHARGSIYGDVLSSLLEYVGYKVVREYYVNDAGNQMQLLVRSIYIRYLELSGKYKDTFPEDCYPGSYVIDAARLLKRQYTDQLLNIDEKHRNEIIRDFAIEFMMDLIKTDLKSIGVVHDVFFYESLLHKENKIEEVVKQLQDKGVVYKGVLEQPKGMDSAEWEEREQLLFKSTDFGDDIDRALQKPNGEWTYFAADIAYLNQKLSRNFDSLILVLGADHIGYQKRMEAACRSLNNDVNILNIKLCQLVVFLKDGQPFKMSKRSGHFLSISQVIRAIGKDVLKFMMLTRKNDALMEIDFVKVKEQSKDNPVFYVQYAHSRAMSVLANAEKECPEALKDMLDSKADLSLLNSDADLELIKYLSYWPKQIEIAAQAYEPHRLTLYMQNLASYFHAFWNKGKNQHDLRFIISNNVPLTAARLTLVQATINIIRSGLNIIGVAPLNKM